MKAIMDKYFTCYKVYLKNFMAYPGDVFIKLVYVPIQMIIVYFLWKTLSKYQHVDVNYMIHYYLLTYLILYSYPFLHISSEIQEDIFSGSLSNYMVRPINILVPKLAKFLAWMSIYSLILAVTFIYMIVGYNSSILKILQFIILMFLGLLIEFYIWYVVGTLSFYIDKVRGVMRMLNALRSLLSGSIIPLSYFPRWGKIFIDFSPFKFMIYTPINFLLSNNGNFFYDFLSSLTCLLIFIILGGMLWKFGSQRYQNNLS